MVENLLVAFSRVQLPSRPAKEPMSSCQAAKLTRTEINPQQAQSSSGHFQFKQTGSLARLINKHLNSPETIQSTGLQILGV